MTLIAPVTAATAAEVDVSVVLEDLEDGCLLAYVGAQNGILSYHISWHKFFFPMTLRSTRARPTSCKGKIIFVWLFFMPQSHDLAATLSYKWQATSLCPHRR